jgi:hypothetical protein
MHKIPASHENYGGCLKLWRKTFAENLSASQNLGEYTEFRRSALKFLRLGKIFAHSQNLSGKVWRPLTIWARQNLQLLTGLAEELSFRSS